MPRPVAVAVAAFLLIAAPGCTSAPHHHRPAAQIAARLDIEAVTTGTAPPQAIARLSVEIR